MLGLMAESDVVGAIIAWVCHTQFGPEQIERSDLNLAVNEDPIKKLNGDWIRRG